MKRDMKKHAAKLAKRSWTTMNQSSPAMWQVTFPAAVAWTTWLLYLHDIRCQWIGARCGWLVGGECWPGGSISQFHSLATRQLKSIFRFLTFLCITVCNSHCLLVFDMFPWSMPTGIHSAAWMYDKIVVQGLQWLLCCYPSGWNQGIVKGFLPRPADLLQNIWLWWEANSEATVSFKEVLENARGRVNGVPRNPCGFLAVVIKHVGVSVKLGS